MPGTIRGVVWQLERGAEGGNLHLQIYAEFKAPQRLAAVKRWLPRAHCEPRRGTAEQVRFLVVSVVVLTDLTSLLSLLPQAIAYCRKEETREPEPSGPWTFGDFAASGQGARSDLAAAVVTLKAHGLKRVAQEHPEVFVRAHAGLRALEAILEDLPKDPDFEPRSWQARLDVRLALPPNDRTIVWVHDSVGKKGKSRYCRHLVLEHGAILLGGRIADMMYAYKKERIVCFDITRAQADMSMHLYSMAEFLKNGMFLSTKYESRQVVFTPPHVVFFANVMPEPGRWSEDRLKLIDLDGTANTIN